MGTNVEGPKRHVTSTSGLVQRGAADPEALPAAQPMDRPAVSTQHHSQTGRVPSRFLPSSPIQRLFVGYTGRRGEEVKRRESLVAQGLEVRRLVPQGAGNSTDCPRVHCSPHPDKRYGRGRLLPLRRPSRGRDGGLARGWALTIRRGWECRPRDSEHEVGMSARSGARHGGRCSAAR